MASPRFAKNLFDLDFLNDAVVGLAEEVAEDIVSFIRSSPETPVLTGALRASYHTSYEPETDTWQVVSEVDYWRYVEFGTRRSQAEPHVRPAIEAVVAARGSLR